MELYSFKSLLPAGMTWRELWLPELTNGTTLPSSVQGGHALTLTGARKGSTANGVHFTGAATSNVNTGVLHDAATKLWVSLRFKLDSTFAAGAASDQFILSKYVDDNNRLEIVLSTADGKMRWQLVSGAVTRFSIATTETSWTAGAWYHVLCSLSSVNAARLRINNGTAVTDADTTAVFAAGDFVIGDRDDPGAGTGFKGVIADVIVGTDDLTTAEEADLYKGVPPADAVNFWKLDEGRGTTAYDRGSGGNNGTLDTTATWDFTGQPKLPVLSLDGINDVAASSSGVDISGSLSVIWVGKVKSTYNASTDQTLYTLRIDGSNRALVYYNGTNLYHIWVLGGAATQFSFSPAPAIDQYWILVSTKTASATALYINGASQGSAGGVVMPATAATARLGDDSSGAVHDVSSPLLFGLVDGALSTAQVLALSKRLNEQLNLKLSI